MNPGNRLLPDDLLSIDVDAHVQKLAANTFASRFHYPVELVRLALARGADRVEVKMKPHKIEILDNGQGIGQEQMELLLSVLVPNQSPEVREQSVEKLKTRQGIGLLAIFSPSPGRVLIENAGREERKSILIEGRNMKESASCTIKEGSRVTLFRNSSDLNQEKAILQDYCRAVQKDIFLNGKAIEKKSILTPPAVVSLKLKASAGIGEGVVGIPRKGDLCKIWLLDQGIPWYFVTLRPWKGFIFSAALEFKGDVIDSLLNNLLEPVTRLYYWLAQRYPSYPKPFQSRVEELLFKHNRLTADNKMVNCFSPFKVIHSSMRLSLSQVARKAASEVLYAVPAKENPWKYNTAAGTTLLLSRNQVDFLVNHQRIPLTFLTPVMFHKNPLSIFYTHTEKLKHIISRTAAARRKRLDNSKLGSAERVFLESLAHYLKISRITHPDLLPGQGIEPTMIHARGISPGVLNPPFLLINRKHPLVRKAVRAHQLDPRSIELAAALFL